MTPTDPTAAAGTGPGDVGPAPSRRLPTALLAVALAVYSAVALGVVVALFGATLSPPPGSSASGEAAAPLTQSAPDPSFVTRSGQSLRLEGTTFRFTGFNLYNAAASDLYSCPTAVRLDDAQLNASLTQVRAAGGTVVRVWAFQSYTRGGRDYAGLDRVLAAARAHGLKVLPVLENQWAACSRPRVGPLSTIDDGDWFTTGYRTPLPGQPLSFRDYARRITHHYRDDPTIVAWSLMNEAETTRVTADGTSELVGFARDVSAVVHQADPHHLLTLGTQSNGAPGASGKDFSAVYGLPGIDLAEVHDWANRGSDALALPGASNGALPAPSQCQSTTAPIACSFALAKELDKPIVVGEAGIAADDPASRTTRSEQLEAKVDAAFRAGASGYLIWQLNDVNTDTYGVLVGSNDPLYAVLRAVGSQWALDRPTLPTQKLPPPRLG